MCFSGLDSLKAMVNRTHLDRSKQGIIRIPSHQWGWRPYLVRIFLEMQTLSYLWRNLCALSEICWFAKRERNQLGNNILYRNRCYQVLSPNDRNQSGGVIPMRSEFSSPYRAREVWTQLILLFFGLSWNWPIIYSNLGHSATSLTQLFLNGVQMQTQRVLASRQYLTGHRTGVPLPKLLTPF